MTTWHGSTGRAGPAADLDSELVEVQAFLDRYAAALIAGDRKGMAELWAVPALAVADAEVRVVATLGEIERSFGGARDQYNSRGIVDTRAEILTLRWPTEAIALVEVRWPYLDTTGGEAGDETATYILRRHRGGPLRIQAVIEHGASTI